MVRSHRDQGRYRRRDRRAAFERHQARFSTCGHAAGRTPIPHRAARRRGRLRAESAPRREPRAAEAAENAASRPLMDRTGWVRGGDRSAGQPMQRSGWIRAARYIAESFWRSVIVPWRGVPIRVHLLHDLEASSPSPPSWSPTALTLAMAATATAGSSTTTGATTRTRRMSSSSGLSSKRPGGCAYRPRAGRPFG